jgi:hypothetical protein
VIVLDAERFEAASVDTEHAGPLTRRLIGPRGGVIESPDPGRAP